MLSFSKSALAVVLILSAGTASAGKKRVTLYFQPTHPPNAPCLNLPLISWEESDSFFKDVKQVKSKGAVGYRRGNDIIENFPDELTVNILFLRGNWLFSTCGAGLRFDPETVCIHAEWRDGSQARTAKGTVVQSESGTIGTVWCEDRCTEGWQYKLRIESENVSLADNLVIRIDAENGSSLAEYVGKVAAVEVERTPSANLAPLP